jgi:hypothetical protein
MITREAKTNQIKQIGLIAAIILIVIALIFTTGIDKIYSSPSSPSADVTERWSYSLPTKICSTGKTDCQISSPVLADLNGDNLLEIIVATNSGHIVALNQSDGSIRWNKDISTAFGTPANTNEITSSPAVADIDKDGQMEIAVGVGSLVISDHTQGGMVVLDHNGNIQSGWPQKSYDNNGDGYSETIFSTPALGDLDKDGYLEIVAGGFDKRIYAWRYDGTLMPGFPIDSYLHQRFPTWGLTGTLADTIWSSPSLADLDGDGYLDIVIGTDEGNFDSTWPGDSGGWICPYTLPAGWANGYCGGSLYAVDRFGDILPGFPKHILETIQSTPALADIDSDGSPEIFVGTGSYYFNNSPDHPTYGFRLHGWDNNGNDLPGWSGGKVVNNVVSASPAVGDITGDATMEIVVGTKAGTLYAWHADGSTVSGFPMTPKDLFGNTYPYGQSFALADYDGDGKMEIFFNQASMVTVVDGNGQQLTASNTNTGAPAFRTRGANRNGPAVCDVDNDGKLELVAHSDQLFLWDLNSSSDAADWPMFKHDAARTGSLDQPTILISPLTLIDLHPISDNNDILFQINLRNNGKESIAWSAVRNDNDITLSSSGGTLVDSATILVNVDRSSLAPGINNVGSVTITGTVNGANVVNSPTSVPITVYLVNEVHEVYLPSTMR